MTEETVKQLVRELEMAADPYRAYSHSHSSPGALEQIAYSRQVIAKALIALLIRDGMAAAKEA